MKKMLMVRTNLLVLVKNALFQLTSVLGKIVSAWKALELKHAAKRYNRDYSPYFENKKHIKQWIFDKETYRMKESDRFYVV